MGLLDQQVPHPNDRDTVNITADELRAIADAVESLAQIRGSVSAIEVGGLQVGLRLPQAGHRTGLEVGAVQ